VALKKTYCPYYLYVKRFEKFSFVNQGEIALSPSFLRISGFAVLCAALLSAQTNRGGITGTVFDPAGAVIPNAAVTVTNVGTNQVVHEKTSASGSYSLPSLDPVVYRVEAEAPGFRKKIIDNVKIDTGSIATVDIHLETGSVSSEVTVQADVTQINTDNGTLSSTITSREIQDAPLLNRSVLDLALTLPNISGDAGSEDPTITSTTPCPGCNLSVGGGRPLSTLILADGANNTGVSLARTITSFTPETVQEFTVQTSAFSAEYGNSGGGVISVTTKSGTNQLSGTVLWYNRNPDFAAAPFTLANTNRPLPTLKYNQFSASAGGPVVIPKLYNGRNKTFFFGAVEPEYRRDHLDQYGLLPTPGMLKGDFSGLVNTPSGWLPQSVVNQFASSAPSAVGPVVDSTIYNNYSVVNGNQFVPSTATTPTPFPNNIIPQSLLDSSALKAIPYFATAGPYYLNSNGLISNLYAPRQLSQNEIRYTGKIDQIVSNNNRLSGRYTITPITKIQGTPVSPTNNGAVYSSGQQALISDTHTFSPTVINDARINYTHGRFSQTTAPEYDAQTGTNLNTVFGLPNITKGGVPAFNGLFPGSALGGGSSTATGFGSGGSTNEDDKEERYAATDIVYKVTGNMSWKFGGDFSRSLQNITPLYAALGGQYSFSSIQTSSTNTSSGTGGSPWASFLLGVPNGNVTLRPVEIPYYYRYLAADAFVQNDWKIRPNLTLNFGVRWNLELPRTEKYNHQGVFRPDLSQSFPLSSPLTLADGEVIKSVNVVPFAFSGIGGNSPYLTPPQYRDFEPRFGFAWSPRFLASHRVTIRGGYGLSHAPISGFTQLPQPDFSATSGFASTAPSGTANPNYVMRLGENPPVIPSVTANQVIYGSATTPTNGLSVLNSLYYQNQVGAFAVSQNYHTPYVNNWNVTTSWQANNSTTVELAYSGNMGIHLFMGQEDINPKDSNLLSAELAQNISTTGTIADPLGRINLQTGKVLTIQNGTLGSPYLGLSSLYNWFDASGNSIRHAGSASVIHRAGRGLTFSANYTYGKSIDTGSSAGGDKGILTPVGGQVGGQVIFGSSRSLDRSVSTYDQRHVIHATALYDLPVGRGRRFLNHGGLLDYALGGWTLTGLERLASGFPYIVYLSDTNQLGDATHSARPDIVPGVPLVNPLYSSSCPTGSGCQPYINPAAFERPALGAYGTAPRTLDGARGPWQQNFDASIQKNFRLGESGKRRIQFRVDLLNAFNHPVFAVVPNSGGGADFMGAPSTATLTTAAYNTWAAANSQPLYSTPAGVTLYNQIVANVNAQKVNGVLPANFFTTPLPANFYGTPATSYNITTTQGYKLYQLRNAYSTSFGTLYNSSQPRFIQFGIKLYF
jgi:hypothetical protein